MKVKSQTLPASPALGTLANVPDLAGLPNVRLLGVRIDCLRLPALLNLVGRAAARRARLNVLYVNVHCMNVAARDHEYAAILESADLVYCDGTGVRLGARLAGLAIPERMTGADWIHDLCRLAVRDRLSLYFLGGSPGSAREAAELLSIHYPGLRVVGTCEGYNLGPESIQAVNHASPDILLVGMGTPTQEKWIARHPADLNVPVIWAVGAVFDFVNGRIPRGPHWLTEHGFEWLCRLVVEPGKLWRRYLIGNPWFIWRVIRHYWAHRRS